MASVENLDRLQGIVTRLRPLADTRRGELIRADDWNTIVAALLELARAVLASDASGDVPAHSHDDQVQVSWLDARLRSLLQEGPLGDPRSVSRVAAVERAVDEARGELGTVRATVDSLRDRVGDVTTRDVAREADVASLRLTVENVNDSRRDVLTLRTALDAIRTDLQRALELASGLTVDGKPINGAEIVRRLAAVEELRTALTRDDGELLDAATFERRLAEHAATLVTTEQLEATLKRLRPRISEEQASAIRQDVLAAAQTQMESSLASLRTDVDAAMEKRLADVDSRIANGVASAVPGIRDEVRADALALLDDRMATFGAETREQVERRLGEAFEAFDARLDERVSAVRDEVLAGAREHVEAVLRESVDPLRDVVAKMHGRLDSTSNDVYALRDHVAAVEQRVAGVADEAVARAREETFEIVRSEIAGVHERLEGLVADAVARRFEESAEQLRAEMRDVAAAGDQGVRDEMRKFVPAVVERAMSTLDERIARDYENQGPISEVLRRIIDEELSRR